MNEQEMLDELAEFAKSRNVSETAVNIALWGFECRKVCAKNGELKKVRMTSIFIGLDSVECQDGFSKVLNTKELM